MQDFYFRTDPKSGRIWKNIFNPWLVLVIIEIFSMKFKKSLGMGLAQSNRKGKIIFLMFDCLRKKNQI